MYVISLCVDAYLCQSCTPGRSCTIIIQRPINKYIEPLLETSKLVFVLGEAIYGAEKNDLGQECILVLRTCK